MNLCAFIHMYVNVFIWEKNMDKEHTDIHTPYPWMSSLVYTNSFTDFIFSHYIPQKLCFLSHITLWNKKTDVRVSHFFCVCESWTIKKAEHWRIDAFFFLFFNFTILHLFCHISTWIRHRYTLDPHPELSSLLPPHTIPLGHPSAPAPSIQYCASNLDWRLVSCMTLYMFQWHSPRSSHPLPLQQSP